MQRYRNKQGGWSSLQPIALSPRNYELPIKTKGNPRMVEVVEVMTLCVDPTNGEFYVAWGEGVPPQYKAQMQASFGAMFKELPASAIIANRPEPVSNRADL